MTDSFYTFLCSVASVVSNSLRPMDCSLPGSSVRGMLQARILEWVSFYSPWFEKFAIDVKIKLLRAADFVIFHSFISTARAWGCSVIRHGACTWMPPVILARPSFHLRSAPALRSAGNHTASERQNPCKRELIAVSINWIVGHVTREL